jgi:hypothetical protein
MKISGSKPFSNQESLSEIFQDAKTHDIFRKESFRNGEPFQTALSTAYHLHNAEKLRTPDTLRSAPKPTKQNKFESLISGVKHNTAVDQQASEVAEKALFLRREKEAHDNLIAQEQAHNHLITQPAASQLSAIQLSIMRRFDTEQGAIAEQRAMANLTLSMAMPAVGTKMHSSRRRFAKQTVKDKWLLQAKLKDKWLLQAKLNAGQSVNQMDTPWSHPGDGTARSIKPVLCSWCPLHARSKNAVPAPSPWSPILSKWNTLVNSEARVEKFDGTQAKPDHTQWAGAHGALRQQQGWQQRWQQQQKQQQEEEGDDDLHF